ncbi:hypothetical protein BKA81DRAFT_374441 [Phyllosticta paracitricarpa]
MDAAPWSGIVGGEGLGWSWLSVSGLCLLMIGEWVIGVRARVGVCAGTNDDDSQGQVKLTVRSGRATAITKGAGN